MSRFLSQSVLRTGFASARMKYPLAVMLALAFTAPHAMAQQGQSMEERLRTQLRATTSQLQQVQAELAELKAAGGAKKPAPVQEQVQDTSNKEVEKLRSQLAAERRLRAGAEERLQQAGSQLAQFRNAYDELLKMARASESERQRQAADATGVRDAVARCEAKNVQLYGVAQEILRAYETIDITTVMAARQPFATKSRVKLEQVAQQYGDKLYESRFDVRASETREGADKDAMKTH